jgi:hypothetical protein
MLSKTSIATNFKSSDVYSNETNTYSIKPGMCGGCQELDFWKTTLSNGKEVIVEVGRLYGAAKFTIELNNDEYSNLLSCSKTGTIVLNDFDYNLIYTKGQQDTWIEINGVPLNLCTNLPNITQQEKMELYRIIYKWDVISREKSSGSESNSDSDFDEEKLNHNNCKHLSTKYAIIRGYQLIKL